MVGIVRRRSRCVCGRSGVVRGRLRGHGVNHSFRRRDAARGGPGGGRGRPAAARARGARRDHAAASAEQLATSSANGRIALPSGDDVLAAVHDDGLDREPAQSAHHARVSTDPLPASTRPSRRRSASRAASSASRTQWNPDHRPGDSPSCADGARELAGHRQPVFRPDSAATSVQIVPSDDRDRVAGTARPGSGGAAASCRGVSCASRPRSRRSAARRPGSRGIANATYAPRRGREPAAGEFRRERRAGERRRCRREVPRRRFGEPEPARAQLARKSARRAIPGGATAPTRRRSRTRSPPQVARAAAVLQQQEERHRREQAAGHADHDHRLRPSRSPRCPASGVRTTMNAIDAVSRLSADCSGRIFSVARNDARKTAIA